MAENSGKSLTNSTSIAMKASGAARLRAARTAERFEPFERRLAESSRGEASAKA